MQVRATFFAAITSFVIGTHTNLMAQPAGSGASAESGSPQPSGLIRRAPWTTSRITGSPEPPSPYRTEPIFPKLKFVEPLELVALPGSNRLVLAEHGGKIYSFPNDPACDNSDVFADMKAWNREIQEVYSVTFHPDFPRNRFLYIWYILKPELPAGTRISRFLVPDTNPPRADLGTEQVIITWKSGGHNGGNMRFGKDGMFYISTGDGVGPDPPDSLNTGQDISDLLSSILRIDVDHTDDGKNYAIPRDNPFIQTPGARPEVWAYGFRNPWRLSADLKNGELWTADVGWELWEMVYRVERGGNYGWSIMEGSRQVIKADAKRGPTPILPPTFEHPHSESSSITGGFIYHGKRLPDLDGSYIYGDFDTGKIWALRHDGTRVTAHRELVDTPFKVVSFGEDHDGELSIVDFNGTLHQLVPNSAANQAATFPRKLSETGLFNSLTTEEPAPGVIPYSVNAGQWVDGAVATRYVALPGDSVISTKNSPWTFPKDAVFVRTLALPLEVEKPVTARKVETQLLHFNGEAWNAYAYRWNDEQSDAVLVGAAGSEQTFTVKDASGPGGLRQQTWRFASRSECLRCHNPWCGSVLGFNTPQLDRQHGYRVRQPVAALNATPGYSEMTDHQLRGLAHTGTLDRIPENKLTARLVSPHDPAADLRDRARSWLHINCSHCHREHAGGAVLSFMNFDWPLEKLNLVGAKPVQGTFDMPGAEVVAPGDPYRSALYYRVSKLGKGHMPYIGSRMIDERGTAVIHDWIQGLTWTNSSRTTNESEAIANTRSEQLAAAGRLRSNLNATDRDHIIDQLIKSASGALVLLRTLETSTLPAGTLEAVMARSVTADRSVADLFERYVPEEKRIKTLGSDIKPETILSLRGDAERGRRIFSQPGGAQCNTCHRLHNDGREFGPDLGQIGRRYTRAQILENLLEPSKTIDPKFVAYTLERKSGDSHTGFVLNRGRNELVIKDATGAEIKIPTGEIVSLTAQKLSLMPDGLLQNLTALEAADLVEYLGTLR